MELELLPQRNCFVFLLPQISGMLKQNKTTLAPGLRQRYLCKDNDKADLRTTVLMATRLKN